LNGILDLHQIGIENFIKPLLRLILIKKVIIFMQEKDYGKFPTRKENIGIKIGIIQPSIG
jgi:hypothetical protein